MIAPENASSQSSRFWLRCLCLILLSCVILLAAYTSIDMPDKKGSWYFIDDSRQIIGCHRVPYVPVSKSSGNDTGRLFYNRVPKCGSTTMLTLIQKLAARNGFVHVNSKVYHRKTVDEEEQRRIVTWVKETPSPCSFDRHVYFINFTRFGESAPIYMNLIRDPVERIISSFFFRRMTARNQTIAGIRSQPSANWLNKKFHHCVMDGDPECKFVAGQNYTAGQLSYFCGQEPYCFTFNDPNALQKAKQNIADSYAVVGVLEHMNTSLRVMEAVLPRFFDGAFNLYHSLGVYLNQNLQKQEVPEKIKLQLKGYLTDEYELYNFVVWRLYRQYKQLVQSKQKRNFRHQQGKEKQHKSNNFILEKQDIHRLFLVK